MRASKRSVVGDRPNVRAASTPDELLPGEGLERLIGELIEHVPSAMFAMDPDGVVLQANARFESLVGIPRDGFVGAPLGERLVPALSRALFRASLGRIRSGESDTLSVSVETGHGSTLTLECDVRRYGRAEKSPWLVTVMRSRVERPADELRPYDAFAYTVRRHDDGRLVLDDGDHAGAPCFRVVYARESKCPRCPVDEAIATQRPVETAFFDPGTCEAIVVRALASGSRARCERVMLTRSALEEITRARVDARVEIAGLSTRERDVLAHLRLGRTLEEVATLLGISHHTVKFHTANILQKLGADSRLDLMRILG